MINTTARIDECFYIQVLPPAKFVGGANICNNITENSESSVKRVEKVGLSSRPTLFLRVFFSINFNA